MHDFGFYLTMPGMLIEKEDNFYILLFGIGESTQPATRNAVAKFTGDGTLVWLRFLDYPNSANPTTTFHHIRGLAISKDNDIYAMSHCRNEVQESQFLMNKFNDNGDLIWSKTFGFTGLSAEGQWMGLTLAADSTGFIMTGRTLEPSYKKYVAMKIDSSGSMQWKKLFTVPLNSVGEAVPAVQMPDGSIKCAFDNSNDYSVGYIDHLMSIDSNGNMEYIFANPLTGRAHDLRRHPNGNLVYLSNERNPPMGEWGGLRVQMLTPEFDTVWSALFYDTEFPYLFLETGFVRNLSILPDGRILALGYNVKNCILLCYSPDGALLWKREVALEGFEQLKFEYASWTSDGSILLTGFIVGDDPDNPTDSRYKVFIMRLDSVGCLIPDCEQTIVTDTKEINPKEKNFHIAPNPTADIINIENRTPQGDIYDYTIKIYDDSGRLIFQENQVSPVTTFNLSGQKKGVYLISVSNSKNNNYVYKIVKI